jgi:hypothetical protein
MEEALASGQINVTEPFLGRKKRKRDEREMNRDSYGCVHNSDHGKTRGSARVRGTDNGWRGRGRGRTGLQQTSGDGGNGLVFPSAMKNVPPTRSSTPSSSGSDDGIPEVASSKPRCSVNAEVLPSHDDSDCPTDVGAGNIAVVDDIPAQTLNSPSRRPVKPLRKVHPAHPKKPPHNPFASRPVLLRNVRRSKFAMATH